jgi:DNA-directed RNA polymerase specialized sigma24 family protein
MNAHTPTHSQSSQPSLSLVHATRPANDTLVPSTARPTPPRAVDPITQAHARFGSRLRAAARQYASGADVDDLLQDVWLIASRTPAKLDTTESTALSWLIGIAKRCAPSYTEREVTFVPLDELLLREAGDDQEGGAIHAARARRKGGKREKRRQE